MPSSLLHDDQQGPFNASRGILVSERTTKQKPHSKPKQVEEAVEQTAADTKAALKQEIDDLLDEIDGVLEENAEDFVRSYIQKGGQ